MLGFQILGGPGCDNAVHVRIDSGLGIERILFDCGEGCLQQLNDDVRETDLLVFSHFHMDHVSGFDGFFRPLPGAGMAAVAPRGPEGFSRLPFSAALGGAVRTGHQLAASKR